MAFKKIDVGASASPAAAVFLLFSLSRSGQVFFFSQLYCMLPFVCTACKGSAHQRPTKTSPPLLTTTCHYPKDKYRRRSAEVALAQNQAKEEAEVSLNQFYGSLAGASCSSYTLYKQMGTDLCQAISECCQLSSSSGPRSC